MFRAIGSASCTIATPNTAHARGGERGEHHHPARAEVAPSVAEVLEHARVLADVTHRPCGDEEERADHDRERDRVGEERGTGAERREHEPGEGGPEPRGAGEVHRVEPHRTEHVLGRHELRDERLPGRDREPVADRADQHQHDDADRASPRR